MKIKIVKEKISREEIEELAKEFYITLLKGVVDIEKEIMALGGEYHMDANMELLEKEESKQENIWGFNIIVGKTGDEMIEYVSLINIRPNQNNRQMEIESEDLRQKMKSVILKFINNE